MEPSYMDDLVRTLKEKLEQIKTGAQEAPGRIAHAVQPVTDRVKMLATDPGEFARTGFQALKQQAAPQIAAAGTAGVMATGAVDPSMRQGASEELMDPAIAQLPPEERQAAITQALYQRALQRSQYGQ